MKNKNLQQRVASLDKKTSVEVESLNDAMLSQIKGGTAAPSLGNNASGCNESGCNNSCGGNGGTQQPSLPILV